MKPILNLTIKRNWLAMIACGIKKEEYRAPNCAQLRRWLEKQFSWRWKHGSFTTGPSGSHWSFPVGVFRGGYSDDSPALAVEIKDALPPITFGKRGVFAIEGPRFLSEPAHPEWGEPPTPHWTLILGDVRFSGRYADVRAWMEGLK